MTPKGSSLHSQELQSQIDPVNAPTALLKDTLQYYLPIYSWVFQVVSFPQVSPPKPCMNNVLHATPIVLFLTGIIE